MTQSLLIFVVEDDPFIHDLVQGALEDGGFQVTAAFSGEEALALLETENLPIRALITDVNLSPDGLTGWDVAKRARELNPEMPIVYMTGAAGHEWTANGVPNSILLAKPFAPVQVATAISQLLNESGTALGQL